MAKITSITGGKYEHAEPNQELIEHVEELLAMARSGELQQLLYAGVHYDEAVSRGSAGRTISRYAMVGGAHVAIEEYRKRHFPDG